MSENNKKQSGLTAAGSRFLRDTFDVQMSIIDKQVTAKIMFHDHHEGPPGHAHGGSIATVMDELMGGAAFAAGYMALAAHLELDYRKPVPLHTPLIATTDVVKEGNRSIGVKGQLMREDNQQLLAESSAVFVHIGGNKFLQMGDDKKSEQKFSG